jgi:hypothetical protein
MSASYTHLRLIRSPYKRRPPVSPCRRAFSRNCEPRQKKEKKCIRVVGGKFEMPRAHVHFSSSPTTLTCCTCCQQDTAYQVLYLDGWSPEADIFACHERYIAGHTRTPIKLGRRRRRREVENEASLCPAHEVHS